MNKSEILTAHDVAMLMPTTFAVIAHRLDMLLTSNNYRDPSGAVRVPDKTFGTMQGERITGVMGTVFEATTVVERSRSEGDPPNFIDILI